MNIKKVNFNTSSTTFYFAAGISYLKEFVDVQHAVMLVDETVFTHHAKRFKDWKTIVLKSGEKYKQQPAVDAVIKQLIAFGADRKTTLIGVGGGVTTDMTGYIAGIYMRGIQFGFVPTTILAMVDASIGGKNGIDVGVYKNMVGTIIQPSFILHDLVFLNTLPEMEWQNGFAEIIKHACIKDAAMFKDLEAYSLKKYRSKKTLLCDLIQRNALLKTKVVIKDEFETGDRKLLNFGHTFGHAIENTYKLSHGYAVAVGMVMACMISEACQGFKDTNRVVELIKKYGLPVHQSYKAKKVIDVMKADKKKVKDVINYVLLQKIGKAVVQPISIDEVEGIITQLEKV
ncbi:3-dehydroquinate synthase [Parafilimonas sp.]|uniref:3-dehydroquinate synthase n=1 Tax=Parafilimonas sp. TaxID=1969739 RepID=UPI0039E36D3A